MKVFTYYDEAGVNADAGWLINRWTENWRGHGFEPVVLNDTDARKHPRYAEHMGLFLSLPTVNPKLYELTCYKRWCAMAMVGGMMTDYDLFCISLKPFVPEELTFYDRNRVPCAVSGTRDQFERVLKWFWDYTMDVDDNHNGIPHISDMKITTRHPEAKTVNWVMEYGEERGKRCMVHFSNDSSGGSKRRAIERFFQ